MAVLFVLLNMGMLGWVVVAWSFGGECDGGADPRPCTSVATIAFIIIWWVLALTVFCIVWLLVERLIRGREEKDGG